MSFLVISDICTKLYAGFIASVQVVGCSYMFCNNFTLSRCKNCLVVTQFNNSIHVKSHQNLTSNILRTHIIGVFFFIFTTDIPCL